MANAIGAFLRHFVAKALLSLTEGSLKCEAVMEVSVNLDAWQSVICQLNPINVDQVNVSVIPEVYKKLKLQIAVFQFMTSHLCL